MKASRYEANFKRLKKIIPTILDLKPGDALKLESRLGFMPLHVDILSSETTDLERRITVSLAHYYEQNGDLIPDPDMELLIHVFSGPMYENQPPAVEALSYRCTYLDQRVYPQPGYVNPKMKQQLNVFLTRWLKNIIMQRHQLETAST